MDKSIKVAYNTWKKLRNTSINYEIKTGVVVEKMVELFLDNKLLHEELKKMGGNNENK